MSGQNSSTIWIEDKGNHLVVVSDNPAQKNVLTMEYHALQMEAFAKATKEDRIAAIILVGRGGYFSAGGELGLLRAAIDGDDTQKEHPVNTLQASIAAIRACPKPVIAAVSGGAAGGGLSTVLACDLVVAEDEAMFLAAHVKIGATLDGGLTSFLGNQLPHQLASELCLLGSVVGAETLHQHGLVNKLVAKGTAESEATLLAEKFARGPVSTQGRIKALLNSARNNSLEDQLDLEKSTLVSALGAPAALEGVSAFLDKRRPDFVTAEGRQSAN